MWEFEPERYGEATQQLLEQVELCELGPGKSRRNQYEVLSRLTAEDIVPGAADGDMAMCCLSALWLRHNFLDESHTISQDISSPSGSYWHGIMHRREPDYSNAKYWYRRVGDHPIFPDLLQACHQIVEQHSGDAANALQPAGSWDPYLFVDVCASASRGSTEDQLVARQVATAEWELLYDYCYQQASA